MAAKILIKELNKKKDEISAFISKLESIIEEKKIEIDHVENTIRIFENDSQNLEEQELEETANPNIIKHDFNNSLDTQATSDVGEHIKKAIKKQAVKVEQLHHDEKEILKQFKQLMRG